MRKNSEVGRLIKIALDNQDWDQTDLARALNISDAWVSKIMHGKIQLTVPMLLKIGEVLRITPASLLPISENSQKDFRNYVGEIIEEKLIEREKAKQNKKNKFKEEDQK